MLPQLFFLIFGYCGQDNLHRRENLVALSKNEVGLTCLKRGQEEIPGPIMGEFDKLVSKGRCCWKPFGVRLAKPWYYFSIY
jgi:hypothetical protein